MKNKTMASVFLISIMTPFLGVFAADGLPVIRVGTRAESAKMVINSDVSVEKEEAYGIEMKYELKDFIINSKKDDIEKEEAYAIKNDVEEIEIEIDKDSELSVDFKVGKALKDRVAGVKMDDIDKEESYSIKETSEEIEKEEAYEIEMKYELKDVILNSKKDDIEKEEAYSIKDSATETPDLNLHCVKGECDIKDDDCEGDDCDLVEKTGGRTAGRAEFADFVVAEKDNSDIKLDGIDKELNKNKQEDWIEILSYAKNDTEWEYTPIDDNGNPGLKLEDENGGWIEIHSVQAKEGETGKIKGTQTKSVFGIFAIEMEVEAEVDSKGNLSNIDKPWYSFLTW